MMEIMKGNASRKLTLEQVMEMRRLYAEGATQGALSRYFSVSIGQVGRIMRGESWQKGAGTRMPSQAEMDGVLARALATQARINAHGAAGGGQSFAAEPARSAPPSPLDGGDAPSEVDGSGLTAVQIKAAAYGLDIDKLLKQKDQP